MRSHRGVAGLLSSVAYMSVRSLVVSVGALRCGHLSRGASRIDPVGALRSSRLRRRANYTAPTSAEPPAEPNEHNAAPPRAVPLALTWIQARDP